MPTATGETAGGTFWRTFRHAAWSNVEFSFDDDPAAHTTMVKGRPGFFARFSEFVRDIDYAADFHWAVGRFDAAIRPDSYLLRVDWSGEEPQAVSLYCRFPRIPSAAGFERAMDLAWPLEWTGPDPYAVAGALGVEGPRGVGLRVDALGRQRVALYYTVAGFAGEFDASRLEPLVAAAGFPPELADTIRADARELFAEGPVGVVGLDPGSRPSTAGAIKLNPPNVPVETAMAYLGRHGVDAERLSQLRGIARHLRAASLSYLGLRYDEHGFGGWRAYMAVVPRHAAPPGLPRVILDSNPIPSLRAPHY